MFKETFPSDYFSQVPKVELHVHLDCSLSYEFVHKYRQELSENDYKNEFIGPAKFRDLAHFLTYTGQQIELMQNEQQLRSSLQDVIQQLIHDNVIYAEIRFAPHLHIQKGLTAFDVTSILCNELEILNHQLGIQFGLILCTLRHFDSSKSMETVELASHFLGKGVVGFDIAGDEAGFSLKEHKAAFKKAHKEHIPITAHAGEAKGALSVWETLAELRPQRIGHGVKSIQDSDLVQKLRSEHIHLEVCPSTNIQIDVFPTYLTHPIDSLRNSGISVSVNTDTRTITGINLAKEYSKLHRAFGWGKDQFYEVNKNALSASFTNSAIKKTLIQKLEEGYKLFEK